MKKLDYLNKILALCTEGERNRFYQMYPDPLTGKQMDWAITQIENTIHVRSHVRATINIREAREQIEQQKSEITELKATIRTQEQRIESLQNTIATLREQPDELDPVERLAKLDALEAGGVDNWEGYDFAMESLCQD